MSAVTGRAEAAVGNLTSLLDTVATPNGMYGGKCSHSLCLLSLRPQRSGCTEMVFMDNPNEFSPVSESACERSKALSLVYVSVSVSQHRCAHQ